MTNSNQFQIPPKESEAIEIPLRNGWKTIIDKEDEVKIAGYKCHAYKKEDGRLYVKIHIRGKVISLHRFLMNVTDPKIDIDHRDGDGLNNRKSNLRPCTHSENLRNQKLSKANTSGFKGVLWEKRYKKWFARLYVNKKHVYGPLVDCRIEAAMHYNNLAIKHYGEFAHLNEIPK